MSERDDFETYLQAFERETAHRRRRANLEDNLYWLALAVCVVAVAFLAGPLYGLGLAVLCALVYSFAFFATLR